MDHVEVHRQGWLAEVVLNRPKVNAMSSPLLLELRQVFDELTEDAAVRGVLVRGAGSCLSAGLDLKEVASLDEPSLGHFLEGFDATFEAIFRYPRPMATAVTGHAIAGGLVLALCSDYIAFGHGAHQHGLTELVVGVPFPPVALEIVKHGTQGRARRTLIYEAGKYSPDQLYAWGVGDSLDDTPVETARRWLQMVTSRPLTTFAFTKAADREQAFQRIANQTLAGRKALVTAMLAARRALLG